MTTGYWALGDPPPRDQPPRRPRCHFCRWEVTERAPGRRVWVCRTCGDTAEALVRHDWYRPDWHDG